MAIQTVTRSATTRASHPSVISHVDVEGIAAGILGAATIAIWFFVLDVINGRPFNTASMLGSALFRHGVGIDQLQTLPISVEMILIFTLAHGLAFCAIGGVASKLLALAERNVNFGFGILLFFVIFEYGFVAAAWIFAEPILHALAWPAVLIGNLLAAAAMGLYFRRHHLNLSIKP